MIVEIQCQDAHFHDTANVLQYVVNNLRIQTIQY